MRWLEKRDDMDLWSHSLGQLRFSLWKQTGIHNRRNMREYFADRNLLCLLFSHVICVWTWMTISSKCNGLLIVFNCASCGGISPVHIAFFQYCFATSNTCSINGWGHNSIMHLRPKFLLVHTTYSNNYSMLFFQPCTSLVCNKCCMITLKFRSH